MPNLYEEAWDSFRLEIERDHKFEPNKLYTPAGILVMLIDHLEKARREAEEFRKEQEKEMEEDYKKRWNTEIKEL